jgi:hypothetical protein
MHSYDYQLDDEEHYCALHQNGGKLTGIVMLHKTKIQIWGREMSQHWHFIASHF